MAMTYVEALTVAIDVIDNEEVIEKLTALRTQVAKKKSTNSKAKREADERAERVYNALAEMDAPVTISELRKLTSDEEVADYNPQRISALLRKLGDRVIRTEEKKVARFSVA